MSRPPRSGPPGKGPSRSSGRSEGGGFKPRRPREEGDRPYRSRQEGDQPRRPYRPREEGEGKPRPYRPRPDGERAERPFRSRQEGEHKPRSFRPREEGERSSRPYRTREEGDQPRRPYRPREEGERSSRPYRARPDGERGERPFRSRQEGEGKPRPYRPRPDGERSSRPYRPREEGDQPRRPFRSRDGGQRQSRPFRSSAEESQFPGERLAKVMARAGIASRRDAEELILAGRVSVNGVVVDTPALNVGDKDVVLLDGKPLPEPERTRLFLYHKPRGRITTARDPEGRPTVFDDLPADLPRLLAVGRLDFNTEGLLLLTNDGGLKRLLELPSTGWLRRYRVRAFGRADAAALAALSDGITVGDIAYGPVEAGIEREQGDNVWLNLALREGKNREVRNILEHLGLEVNRLIRVSYGPFQLGEIEPGAVMEISRKHLREQLGERLAAEAGVDFDGPRRAHQPSPRPEPLDHPRSPRGEERPFRERRQRDEERSERPRPFAGRATGKAERYAALQEGGERKAYSERGRTRQDGREESRPPRRGPSFGRDEAPRRERPGDDRPRPPRRSTIADSRGRRVVVTRKEHEAGEDAHKPRVSKRPFREHPGQERPFDKERSFGKDRFDKDRRERPFGKDRGERAFGRGGADGDQPRRRFGGRPAEGEGRGDRPRFGGRDDRPGRDRGPHTPGRGPRPSDRGPGGAGRGPRPPRRG